MNFLTLFLLGILIGAGAILPGISSRSFSSYIWVI